MRNLVSKAVVLQTLLAATAVCLMARPATVAAQTAPALDNPQIEISYSEPDPSYFRPIYERYKKRQVLEQLKQFLSPLILPPNLVLRITSKECGQVNSWWSGRKDGLFLCYEWPDYAERVAPTDTMPDGMTRED